MKAGAASKVVILAGGVGGARMAQGFARMADLDVTVIVNVGDDEEFHGLKVCPDLDTVLYTLAGKVDRTQGWGVAEDATKGLDVLASLRSPDAWMKLGDADLGLHIFRSNALRQGRTLTEVTAHVAASWGLQCRILPASDAPAPTRIDTPQGVMRFQDWFVRDRGTPTVKRVVLDAAAQASVTPEVRKALAEAALVVVAPSNPFLSIHPMLALAGMSEALRQSCAPKIAVSPLIGGRAVKGPLVQLMRDLGLAADESTITHQYRGLVDALVVDDSDARPTALPQAAGGLEILALATMIAQPDQAETLARALCAWGAARTGVTR